eukprot:GHVL01010190.1.p1 GENE.GHVL01010190.1~~GHVL01010190.1.p1  ORF type:complete len:150 (+),score=20.63 GHVL01010190.1:184-633(+)
MDKVLAAKICVKSMSMKEQFTLFLNLWNLLTPDERKYFVLTKMWERVDLMPIVDGHNNTEVMFGTFHNLPLKIEETSIKALNAKLKVYGLEISEKLDDKYSWMLKIDKKMDILIIIIESLMISDFKYKDDYNINDVMDDFWFLILPEIN